MNEDNSKDRESKAKTSPPVVETAGNGDTRQPRVQRAGGRGIAVFATLISIVALGASGYTWYHIQFTQQQTASDVAIGLTGISGKIEQFGRELDRIILAQQDFVSRDNVELSIERNIDDIREQQTVLEAAVSKVNSNFARGFDAWRLEEVEQLLRVANQGLALTGNRTAAVRALKLADEELQSLADPRYTTVRLAIASDIGLLENSEPPDIAGIAAEMIALAESVSSLPLINEPKGVPVDQPVLAVEEGVSTTWRTELRRLFNDLVGLVKIQKIDEAPRPLLAPEQHYFLEQNLQVMLYGAQLALLRGEYDLFRRNVRQAIDWAESYFDTSLPPGSQFNADLKRIAGTTLVSDNPDISGSMTAFRRVGSVGVIE